MQWNLHGLPNTKKKIIKHRESVKKSRENSINSSGKQTSKDKKDSLKTTADSSPKRSPEINPNNKSKGVYFVLSLYLNMSLLFKVGK